MEPRQPQTLNPTDVLLVSTSTKGEAATSLGCGIGLLVLFGGPLVFLIAAKMGLASLVGALVVGVVALFGAAAVADGLWLLVKPREYVRATSDGITIVGSFMNRGKRLFIPWSALTAIAPCQELAVVNANRSRRNNVIPVGGLELRLAADFDPGPLKRFRIFEVATAHAAVISTDAGTVHGRELIEGLRTLWRQHGVSPVPVPRSSQTV